MGKTPQKPANGKPADFDKEMPQSADAEKGLLSSILIAPFEVLKLCSDSGINAEAFYIEANGEIYATLLWLHGQGKKLDFIIIAQHLRDRNRLEHVGGASALNDLFVYLPTAANAGYYIEILLEKLTARKIIVTGQEFAQRGYTEQDRIVSLLDEFEQRSMELRPKQSQAGALVPLMDISSGAPDPRATVLGIRFLCIGGGMLFVGPSGIGKSSASVQQDVLWSLGRPAFDIRPARPLRILTIQAENDAEDLAEMRDGVIKGLRLTDADCEQVRANVFYETESGLTGAKFLAYVDRRLATMQFDILRLDPLLAYLGADINDAEQTAAFLRNGLNPLLAKHRVACIVNHHTPKVTNRDTSSYRASDWMYAGAGSADVTNWARAALVIDPTHAPHVFKFIAAKRGNRVGWINEDGEREIMRHFCHAADGLYWREATQDDLDAVEAAVADKKNGAPKRTAADLKALIPFTGTISKTKVITEAGKMKIGNHKARGFIDELLSDEQIFLHRIPRPGTNAEPHLSRHEQTLL